MAYSRVNDSDVYRVLYFKLAAYPKWKKNNPAMLTILGKIPVLFIDKYMCRYVYINIQTI